MSLYKNPWAPGLAIPGYVDAEPFGRGTFTTAQLRRRSIMGIPPNWTAGYAVPRNVIDSPPGAGGKLTTAQIKRRTISQWIPDFLMHRGAGDSVAMAETPPASLSGLGTVDIGVAPIRRPGYPGDPIAQYGRDVAAYLMNAVKALPAAERIETMREILEQIDPQLWGTVAEKAEELEKRGVASNVALQRALAASMADGFARELVQIGLSGKVPRSGQVGLAAYGCEPLGGFWSKVKGVVKTSLNTVKNMGCRALNSEGAGYAAGVAGSSAGVGPQAGQAGASIASAVICGSSGQAAAASGAAAAAAQAPSVVYMPAPSAPFPVIPVALIGGAALIAVVLLTRKG